MTTSPQTSTDTTETDTDDIDPTAHLPTLYRHTKRERWGLALVVKKLSKTRFRRLRLVGYPR